MPEVLVDISWLGDLAYVRVEGDEGDEVAIRAATRHCEVVNCEALRREVRSCLI